MTKILMIDPEEGWKYGFPKPAPKDFYEWQGEEELRQWLWGQGYPKGKVPHYVRYFEVDEDDF